MSFQLKSHLFGSWLLALGKQLLHHSYRRKWEGLQTDLLAMVYRLERLKLLVILCVVFLLSFSLLILDLQLKV